MLDLSGLSIPVFESKHVMYGPRKVPAWVVVLTFTDRSLVIEVLGIAVGQSAWVDAPGTLRLTVLLCTWNGRIGVIPRGRMKVGCSTSTGGYPAAFSSSFKKRG